MTLMSLHRGLFHKKLGVSLSCLPDKLSPLYLIFIVNGYGYVPSAGNY